ncbi:MAG: MBL fold metallo-hydrolase, partial [Thermoleophilia bacterium]|nr:MBL fold metallo-hydrolase [Thermoleophilia bacterium]
MLTLHGEPARFTGGLRSVAAGTWAWLEPNGDLGESNAGFVVSGEHVLLIDTLWDLPLTQRMLDAARAAGIARPETVFNTHSDGDHVWGNQLLAGAEIVSSTKAKQLMTLDPPNEMRRMQRGGKLLGAIGSLPLPLVGTL